MLDWRTLVKGLVKTRNAKCEGRISERHPSKRREQASVLTLSMAEVPHARAEHGQAVFVASVDGILVADGAAGLDDGADAVPGRLVDVVAEGKKCVGGQHAPLAFRARLQARHVHGI